MIKFNNSDIIDWNFDDSNIIKVYHNGAIVFYKFDSEQGGYKVCYAVVDDITQYSETEFEDVYDKATEKWYKLNNLSQYEQYGIYGSGRNVTTYEGKLTIDDGYEYIYSGGSWNNVGEVSGSSRVPDGYVELTHVQTIKQDVSNASAFTVPIDIQSSYNYIIEFMPLDWSTNSYYGDILGNDGDTNFPSYGLFKFDNGWGTEWRRTTASFWNYSFDTRRGNPADSKYRFYDNTKAKVTMHLHNYDAAQGADMIVENEGYPTSAITSTSAQKSGYVVSTGVYNSPLFCTQSNSMRMTAYMNFYNLKIETNENVAVYDYIPCKRKSDNKVGLYDVVHNVFHAPLFKLNAGDEASHTEYPKYYAEKSEPLDNLTFNTLEEAQAYAEANCVYDGMHATIDGDRYYFDSTDENGWVKNQHSLPDVPFVLNYNARQYNASTHSIPMTTDQLNDTDAVAYNNPNNIVDHSADGYITISNSSMRIRKQGQDISLFNRTSNSTSSDLTIVCKAKSTSGENIITNRDGNYNWMYRLKTSGILTFHGVSETGSISWNTSNPDIMSVRTYYDSGTKLKYNNWTKNTSTSPTSFTYGSTNGDNSAAGALFVGYSWNYTSEQWSGDFYWIYMSQNVLTDEQVQQVIDYNENL